MIIGLTGNVASGKSVVAEILHSSGVHRLDADEIAHQLLRSHPGIARAIRKRWGKSVFSPDGTVSRKALASLIFSSPKDRRFLENLLHPKIKKEILRTIHECRKKKESLLVVAPLLFEAGFTQPFDEIWLTVAPYPVRLQRLRKRDGLSYREARRRMKSQLPQRLKIPRAQVVISTHKPLKTLKEEVLALWKEKLKT